MPSHKYFSHDSDHVVHPGFLASMHKYKDHFKTLHAYYEKQRTDLWLHRVTWSHSVWPPTYHVTYSWYILPIFCIALAALYLTWISSILDGWRSKGFMPLFLFSAILQPSKMKPVLVEKLLYLPSAKSTLVQNMAAVEIFKIFRLLQNSKKYPTVQTWRQIKLYAPQKDIKLPNLSDLTTILPLWWILKQLFTSFWDA